MQTWKVRVCRSWAFPNMQHHEGRSACTNDWQLPARGQLPTWLTGHFCNYDSPRSINTWIHHISLHIPTLLGMKFSHPTHHRPKQRLVAHTHRIRSPSEEDICSHRHQNEQSMCQVAMKARDRFLPVTPRCWRIWLPFSDGGLPWMLECSSATVAIKSPNTSSSQRPKSRTWVCLLEHYIRARSPTTHRRLITARLAQSVERETLNLKVVGSTPTSGSIPDVQQHLHFLLFFWSVEHSFSYCTCSDWCLCVTRYIFVSSCAFLLFGFPFVPIVRRAFCCAHIIHQRLGRSCQENCPPLYRVKLSTLDSRTYQFSVDNRISGATSKLIISKGWSGFTFHALRDFTWYPARTFVLSNLLTLRLCVIVSSGVLYSEHSRETWRKKNKKRYREMLHGQKWKQLDPPRGRTWNLLIRSQTLCHWASGPC